MFFHKHKYNTDISIDGLMMCVQLLHISIDALSEQIAELRDDVDYLMEFIDND